MNNINSPFTKAKISILLNDPFYASLLMPMQLIEDNSIKTACTDGSVIRYNSSFVNKLSEKERRFLLLHELFHILFLHHLRLNGRNLSIHNIACDYIINDALKNSGEELVKGSLIDNRFKSSSMTSDQVYAILIKNMKNEDTNETKDAGIGDVESPSGLTNENKGEFEQKLKGRIASARMVAQQAGKMPGYLTEMVNELLTPVVNWKAELSSFIQEKCNTDYTFLIPNRKYTGSNIIMPSLNDFKNKRIIIIIDSSGSVDKKLLSEFMGEVKSVNCDFGIKSDIIFADTKVRGNLMDLDDIERFEDIEIKGGGGTSYEDSFKWVLDREEDYGGIIYFTDGFFSDFSPVEIDIPILWAVYNNKYPEMTFGDIIKVD